MITAQLVKDKIEKDRVNAEERKRRQKERLIEAIKELLKELKLRGFDTVLGTPYGSYSTLRFVDPRGIPPYRYLAVKFDHDNLCFYDQQKAGNGTYPLGDLDKYLSKIYGVTDKASNDPTQVQ